MGSGSSTSRDRRDPSGRSTHGTRSGYSVPPPVRSTVSSSDYRASPAPKPRDLTQAPEETFPYQSDPEYPDYPPRRVYTFTEETNKQNKHNVIDNRHKKTHNLVTYNQQHQPESVHVLQEDHVKLESGNSKYEGHTTQSNFVKSTTTVSTGRPQNPARGVTLQVTDQVDNTGASQGNTSLRNNNKNTGRNSGVTVEPSKKISTESGWASSSRKSSPAPRRHQDTRKLKPDVVTHQSGSPTQPTHSYVIENSRHTTTRERQSRARTKGDTNSRSASYHNQVDQNNTNTGRLRHKSNGSSNTLVDANHNTKMPKSYKRPNNKQRQPLAECKVRYLGRYLTQELTEDSLDKLRSHIRLVAGLKTKLKLTSIGIRSGNKYGTLFKHKVPVEFVPMDEIYDVFLDSVYMNLLLVVTKLPGGSYDILGYRVDNDYDGRRLEHQYAQLAAFLAAGRVQTYSPSPLESQGNWTLQQSNYGYDYPHSTIRKANSMNDILYRNTLRSQEGGYWRGGGGDRSRSQSRERYLNRSRSRERSADRLSTASGLSVESMKAEIENLTREVRHLRNLVDERSRQGDGASQKDTDDEVFHSGQYSSERLPGKLVDSNNGTVKVKVGDYRGRAYSASTHVSSRSQGDTVDGGGFSDGQSNGPIRIVYNGSSFDSSDSGVPRGRPVSRDPSTSTTASQRPYRGTARERVAQHQRDSGGAYATVSMQRPAHSANYRSVSQASHDHNRTTDHHLAPPQNVYVVPGSSPGPPARGSRAHRARQGVVYQTYPENPYVARSHSASRYDSTSYY